MNRSIEEKRALFRNLHAEGCFIIPNPWDVGSARYLQGLGFKALASTSAGFAWSNGQSDTAVTRDQVLEHFSSLVAATDLPINADFENGYATNATGVEQNVRLALATGVSGVSIEDATGDASNPIFSLEEAVERLEAARSAFDSVGGEAMLIGRAENFWHGHRNLDDTIARLVAYADAGADCLYAPGITTREHIAEIVAAIAPKPLNILIGSATDMTLQDIAELGVRRVSLGSALARTIWAELMRVATSVVQGNFGALSNAASGQQLDAFFRISGEDPLKRQAAHIVGKVEFREGEGILETIPQGIVEVETTALDAVISWPDGQSHGIAAMPVANFCRYVADGLIVVGTKPPLTE